MLLRIRCWIMGHDWVPKLPTGPLIPGITIVSWPMICDRCGYRRGF